MRPYPSILSIHCLSSYELVTKVSSDESRVPEVTIHFPKRSHSSQWLASLAAGGPGSFSPPALLPSECLLSAVPSPALLLP